MRMLLESLANGLELPGGKARLELLTENHAEGLLAAIDDPVIWRYLPAPPPATRDEIAGIIKSALEARASGAAIPMVVIDRATGMPCGSTRYLEIQPDNRSLEIGWTWLSRRVQRTSVNTECKYLLLRHAFEPFSALRVQLRTDLRNLQSQMAIARLGAVREGVLRKNRVMWDGHQRHTVMFSILDEEWPVVKAGLEAKLARSKA